MRPKSRDEVDVCCDTAVPFCVTCRSSPPARAREYLVGSVPEPCNQDQETWSGANHQRHGLIVAQIGMQQFVTIITMSHLAKQ
jgi:hypothetical protein